MGVGQDVVSRVFGYLGLVSGFHSLLWCIFLVWLQSMKIMKSHSEYLSAYTSLRLALLLWANGTAVFYLFVSGVATDYPRLISCQVCCCLLLFGRVFHQAQLAQLVHAADCCLLTDGAHVLGSVSLLLLDPLPLVGTPLRCKDANH